ncbi:hypothetical protein B0H21DRAFT_701925, partial [Amylocystis lapponica]
MLPLRELLIVARAHAVLIPGPSPSVDAVSSSLLRHICTEQCLSLYSAFRTHSSGVGQPTVRVLPLPPTPTSVLPASFPPPPATPTMAADIVRDWCSAWTSSEVSEAPCAVCARLVLAKMLSTCSEDTIDLRILHRAGDGVMRVARHTASDIVDEIPGPILFPGGFRVVDGVRVLSICPPCLRGIKNHHLPRHSLANGLWLGEVPDELQGLTFVEKLAIARRRHNLFVVKVNSGQRKMCANAVVFSQPVAKFYSALPPARADLDDCLAVLFTGPHKPTVADFQRTPLLLRHFVVRRALHWLKINHIDYADIVISEDNLASYPEDSPPVCVIHRPSDGTENAEAMAVNDSDTERGTESGRCPFVVHGLTGGELISM